MKDERQNKHKVQTNSLDTLISIRIAANHLGISTRAVYRLIAKGDLARPVKVGGASRLYLSDIARYMDDLKATQNH